MGARTNTESKKRRKQEESEYAPALAVTDIVTECDKSRERKAALVELDNPPARSQTNLGF